MSTCHLRHVQPSGSRQRSTAGSPSSHSLPVFLQCHPSAVPDPPSFEASCATRTNQSPDPTLAWPPLHPPSKMQRPGVRTALVVAAVVLLAVAASLPLAQASKKKSDGPKITNKVRCYSQRQAPAGVVSSGPTWR